MINPMRFAADCARAALAIPKIIVRLPALVEQMDHFSSVTMPALVAGAEPLGRATQPVIDAMSRAGLGQQPDAPDDNGQPPP